MSDPITTPATTVTPTAQQPTSPKKSGLLGRRALIGAAAVTVCAASVALAPTAEKMVEDASKAAVDAAYKAGVDAGRQALLAELRNLEGVPLDAAIEVAEITRMAVLYIVRPVSQLFATIAGDALGLLLSGLSSAKSNLATINVHISQLDQLTSMLSQWQTNVTQLPIKLTDYATHDIDSAENYLKSLKKTIQG
jgi:hypothetical protein